MRTILVSFVLVLAISRVTQSTWGPYYGRPTHFYRPVVPIAPAFGTNLVSTAGASNTALLARSGLLGAGATSGITTMASRPLVPLTYGIIQQPAWPAVAARSAWTGYQPVVYYIPVLQIPGGLTTIAGAAAGTTGMTSSSGSSSSASSEESSSSSASSSSGESGGSSSVTKIEEKSKSTVIETTET